MSLPKIGGKVVPQTIYRHVFSIRQRVDELIRQYGSLSKWGRPYLTSEFEVALIYYLNEKLGIGLNTLAGFLGVDKTGLYKIVKKIENGKPILVFDLQTRKTRTITLTPNKATNIVEQEVNPKAKLQIADPFESSIIKKFWTSQIEKRMKIQGKPKYLNERQKKETLRVVKKLMEYIKLNKLDIPSNPDYWREQDIEPLLWKICNKNAQCVSIYMKFLRRVPEWNNWFKGQIGAVTKYITPKYRVLYYAHIVQLKNMIGNGISEREYLVIALHVTTGAREGWSVVDMKEDLDSPLVRSSLIGLKWENITWVNDHEALIQIYESKTNKTWICDLSWLDNDLPKMLRKYAKDKGSIIKTLLHVYGVHSVYSFQLYYKKLLKKISKLLNLPFTLVPHDLRRSHLSILAELGVPLEYAVSGQMDFGVGWEDVKTAIVFYLRFSKLTKQILKQKIEENKKLVLELSKKEASNQ